MASPYFLTQNKCVPSRSFTYFWLFVILCTAVPHDVRCQWTNHNDGLFGGAVHSLIVNGSTIFAGTYGAGIFRSDDEGKNWVPADSGLWASDCYQLISKSGKIYAATSGGVFTSENDGVSWTYLGGANSSVSIALSGDYLFAAANNKSVQRYSFTAKAWQPSNSGLGSISVLAICVFKGELFAATGNGVYKSANNGDSWSPITTGLVNEYVDGISSNDTYLYALSLGSVYRSADGMNWAKIDANSTSFTALSIGVTGSSVFAGLWYNGIFRSADYGSSWTLIDKQLTNTPVYVFADGGNGVYYLGSDSGVFRSSDSGITWLPTSTGLRAVTPNEVIASGSNLYAATRNGIFLSTDNGLHWISKSAGLKGKSQSVANVIVTTGGKIYIGTSGGIYSSSDNGVTWAPSSNGLPTSPIVVSLVKASSGNFYAGVIPDGVFRSSDGGASWQDVNTGLPGVPEQIGVTKLRCSESDIYANLSGYGVYRLSDNSTEWSPMNSGLTSTDIRDFAFFGSDTYAATHDKGFFRSTDHGLNWTAFNTNVQDNLTIGFATDDKSLYSLTLNGIFRMTDDGAGWKKLHQPDSWMTSIDVASGNLYVGGTGELLTAPTDQLIVGIEPFSETTYQLYPNPVSDMLYFNGSGMPDEYKIVNVAGETLKSGVAEVNTDVSGVNVADLPAGMYVFRIRNKDGFTTRKFMVR